MASFDEESLSSADTLLEKRQTIIDEAEVRLQSRSRCWNWRKIWAIRTSIIVHLGLIALYTTIYFVEMDRIVSQNVHGPNLLYSPAHESIYWMKKFINNDVDSMNPYKGAPRPELDEAWHDLFVYNNIRITQEELDRMNQSSVQLADGSGDYLAALDVYHHLHCIKQIRHYLHPEYYDLGESVKVSQEDHIDHCLDAIRNELMCRAEATMTTYEWLPDVPFPWAKLSHDHTCVDFEAIHQWAGSRSIDIFDPKYLVHPLTGKPSYPHGSPPPDHHPTVDH